MPSRTTSSMEMFFSYRRQIGFHFFRGRAHLIAPIKMAQFGHFLSVVPRGEDFLQGWNIRKFVNKPRHNINADSIDDTSTGIGVLLVPYQGVRTFIGISIQLDILLFLIGVIARLVSVCLCLIYDILPRYPEAWHCGRNNINSH